MPARADGGRANIRRAVLRNGRFVSYSYQIDRCRVSRVLYTDVLDPSYAYKPGGEPVWGESPCPEYSVGSAGQITCPHGEAMAIDFYSKSGKPIAYTDDGEHIYTFSGKPVAYLDGHAVHSFSGQHIGWFEDGWIRDKTGKCVLFTDAASGGPLKPVKNVKPVKGVKHVKPIKGVKHVRSVKAVKSLSWSPLSGEQFFI